MADSDEQRAAIEKFFESLSIDPPEVVQKWFFKQVVYLDGRRFEKCRFDHCTLITHTGTFEFDHCVLENSPFLYGDPVVRVTRTFGFLLPRSGWGGMAEHYKPTAHDDGTISILGNGG